GLLHAWVGIKPTGRKAAGLLHAWVGIKPTGRKAAGLWWGAARGCPCPVAGRSLRPSWPSLTRC
ncbi:MAG: hypothetical protein WCO76_04130, partial [Planctomycetota bacterium]